MIKARRRIVSARMVPHYGALEWLLPRVAVMTLLTIHPEVDRWRWHDALARASTSKILEVGAAILRYDKRGGIR